jgi:hypothetical protein
MNGRILIDKEKNGLKKVIYASASSNNKKVHLGQRLKKRRFLPHRIKKESPTGNDSVVSLKICLLTFYFAFFSFFDQIFICRN